MSIRDLHLVTAGNALTPVELRILRYMSTDLTLREIGNELHMSRPAARAHAASVFEKLYVGSRPEATKCGTHAPTAPPA